MMKTLAYCFAFMVALIGVESTRAEESHFRKVEIPSNELRLSELARVREFRCSYELARNSHSTLLIAELYRDGKRVKAFQLAVAVNGNPSEKDTGVISIGWHRDFHNLITVQTNGDTEYSPWTESVHVEGFNPYDAFYFKNSLPEAREAEKDGGRAFHLYPVIGLCGDRKVQISYSKVKDAQSFLDACQRSNAKEALIVYLYLSDFGESPSMKFDNKASNRP